MPIKYFEKVDGKEFAVWSPLNRKEEHWARWTGCGAAVSVPKEDIRLWIERRCETLVEELRGLQAGLEDSYKIVCNISVSVTEPGYAEDEYYQLPSSASVEWCGEPSRISESFPVDEIPE
jgi:hypothetical protein